MILLCNESLSDLMCADNRYLISLCSIDIRQERYLLFVEKTVTLEKAKAYKRKKQRCQNDSSYQIFFIPVIYFRNYPPSVIQFPILFIVSAFSARMNFAFL